MPSHYEVRRSGDGNWYFVLIAGNGEIVSTSEGYTRLEDAERGIEAAREAAIESEPEADDHTQDST